MKLRTQVNGIWGAVAAVWVLGFGAGAVLPVLGVDDYEVSTFGSPDQAAKWARWWGSAGQAYDFDDTMDASDKPRDCAKDFRTG